MIESLPAVPHWPGQRWSVCRRIQEQPRWRGVNWRPGRVGTDRSCHSRARYRGKKNGGLRQAAASADLSDKSPLFEQQPLPAAQQRFAAESHAGGVLQLSGQEMALTDS